MIKKIQRLLFFIFFPSSLWALDVDSVYFQVNAHFEKRGSENSKNFDGLVGFDLGFFDLLFLGPRIGYYRFNEVSGRTRNKVGGGVHVYSLLPLGPLAIKGGVAADVLNGDDKDPVYFYMGLETGLRFKAVLPVYVEIPVEVGTFAFLDPKIFLVRTGLQLGLQF